MLNKKITKRVAVIVTAVALASVPLFARGWRGWGGRGWYQPLPSASLLTTEQTAVVGDWVYYDSTYFVRIDFYRHGGMEITLREGNQTETRWVGSWTAAANQITLNVVNKEVKDYASATQLRTTERLTETWTINYTVADNGALVLTSSNLPSQVASNTTYQRGW